MTSQATWQTDLLWNYKAKKLLVALAFSIRIKLLQSSGRKPHISTAKPRLGESDHDNKLMHETTWNHHFPLHISHTGCHITIAQRASVLTVMEAKRTQMQSCTLGCPWQWISSSTMNTPRALRAIHLKDIHLKKSLWASGWEQGYSKAKILLPTLRNTRGLILTLVTENQQVYPSGSKEDSYQFFFLKWAKMFYTVNKPQFHWTTDKELHRKSKI